MLRSSSQDIPEIHTSEVDLYRKNHLDIAELWRKMRDTISWIQEIDVLSGLELSIQKYFWWNKYRYLRNFFLHHPHTYKDLIRKVHKHREYRNGKWSIPEEKMKDIATLFLVRNRQSDLWKVVNEHLALIRDNWKFTEYCSEQPSILDYSAYQFSRIPSKKRVHDTEWLIKGWLIQNIKGCHEENVHTYFSGACKPILQYVETIFWIYTQDLQYCQTQKSLSDALNRLLDWGWKDRKKWWKIVQAFHAWGNVVEIEKVYMEAVGKVEKMPEKLKSIGITAWKVYTSTSPDWVRVFSTESELSWQKISLSWRVKTPKSILQKMWETEEYTNADAVRDLIWLSVTYPDDTSEEEKQKIMVLFWKIMPHYGYILKNKGELSAPDWTLEKLEEELKKQKKSPLYTSSDLWDSTDPRLRNASMSGFSQVGWMNVGFEIQFGTKSAMEWKKKDDLKYKPRSAILALMRWPKESTPQEIYNLLNKRLSPWDLQKLGYTTINEFMLDLVEGDNKFLIPYLSKDERIVLFTTPKYEEKFLDLWNDDKLRKLDKPHEWVRRYIKSLNIKL